MKMMFVELENTCRSVMSEVLSNQMLEGNVEVQSSGLIAGNGDYSSENILCGHRQ